jgi:hypothetical protein
MGLDITSLEVLLLAIKHAKSGSVLTLGRQGIHISYQVCKYLCEKHGFTMPPTAMDKYCEKLLLHLGASRVDSMDNSHYEQATFVHDLNNPVKDTPKYDLIYDGGTTEHIFNVTQVYDNIIDMLNVGGIFCSVTPNNNQSGHGFYQFSPEMYLRVLSPKYEMEIVNIWVTRVDSQLDTWEYILPTEKCPTRRNSFKFDDTQMVYNLVIARKISNERQRLTISHPHQYSYEHIEWT